MKDKNLHHKSGDRAFSKSKAAKPGSCKFVYWIVGIGSMIWLLLRSGTKPRRMVYPCQRVAAVNSVGFLAYLAALLGSATLLHRLKAAITPGRLVLFIVGLLLVVTLQSSITTPVVPVLAASPDLSGWTSDTAVSDVFAITNVPEPQHSLDGGSVPSGVGAAESLHDDGVDALVNLMESRGDHFYKTTAHPDGLFGTDDVIVLKVNNQWDWRNGTNTDVVKGVIYRLVQHPDGFTGAVIIAENTQNHNDDWYHQSDGNDAHNSQFQDQSYLEVAQAFASEGDQVCIADWKIIRDNFVDDYNDGDSNDGYVLDAGDNKLSYPKFGIDCNGASFQISMRYGLWDGVSSFDNTRLKMINMPVLKRHNCAWATIATKNYLGFITTHGSRWSGVEEMHCWLLGPSDNGKSCTTESTNYGLIARQMAHIRRADLDIVDAIWVNADSNLGGGSVRQDVLLASRDPFAVDYYASDYILGPLIHAQHPTADYEQAMASTHGGWFRNIQLRNVARLRTEGITNTINMDDSMSRDDELAQFNVYVADANAPLTPTLTLQFPNGGEVLEVGTQQQIEWTFTGELGNVSLEYSADGFNTPHTIVASTENDGTHTWVIPDEPSSNVLVRVSSTLTDTISDTSNAVFAITYPVGPHPFEDSFKRVSHASLEGGERITYTIVLYDEISATLTLTDTIPPLCTYVGGSAGVEPDWKNAVQVTDNTCIHWSDIVTSTVPVTITFQVQVQETTMTWAIVNRALVSRNGADPAELRAISFLNGFSVYLPVVFREY